MTFKRMFIKRLGNCVFRDIFFAQRSWQHENSYRFHLTSCNVKRSSEFVAFSPFKLQIKRQRTCCRKFLQSIFSTWLILNEIAPRRSSSFTGVAIFPKLLLLQSCFIYEAFSLAKYTSKRRVKLVECRQLGGSYTNREG